jgi:hypothetical protein
MNGESLFGGITGNRGIATISSQEFRYSKKAMWRKIRPLLEPSQLGGMAFRFENPSIFPAL